MEKQILLSCISPAELKQLVKEVIKEEFIDFKKNLEIKESEVLLTTSETCELLKIDSSKLLSWTKKGKITCYGIAARRYYKRDEILNCLVVLKTTKILNIFKLIFSTHLSYLHYLVLRLRILFIKQMNIPFQKICQFINSLSYFQIALQIRKAN